MYHWDVAKSYLEENPIVQQQIDSFNEFIEQGIHETIEEREEIETKIEGLSIKLHNIRTESPMTTEADGAQTKIYPHEARLRNRTYSGQLFLDISLLQDGEELDRDEVYVGDLPVMVKSDLCYLSGMEERELIKTNEDPQDPGGYFIINGTDRVLVGIEELASNRIRAEKKKRRGKIESTAEVYSEKGGWRGRVSIKRKHRGELKISYPGSPRHMNLFHVLRALGLETKNDIINAFSDEPYIVNDVTLNLKQIEESLDEDPIDALGRRLGGRDRESRERNVNYQMDHNLLRHIGEDVEWMNKAYYLVRMAEKAIRTAKGKREDDDKDHYANKRIKITGELLQDQFRLALRAFEKDIKYQVEKTHSRGRKLKVKTLVRPDSLSQRLGHAFRTGKWVRNRTGVSQTLKNKAYITELSHLRRVQSPLSHRGIVLEARDLHGTHFGRLCPHETPEGQRIGLVKNLSVGCRISSEKIDEDKVLEKISDIGVEKTQGDEE